MKRLLDARTRDGMAPIGIEGMYDEVDGEMGSPMKT